MGTDPGPRNTDLVVFQNCINCIFMKACYESALLCSQFFFKFLSLKNLDKFIDTNNSVILILFPLLQEGSPERSWFLGSTGVGYFGENP